MRRDKTLNKSKQWHLSTLRSGYTLLEELFWFLMSYLLMCRLIQGIMSDRSCLQALYVFLVSTQQLRFTPTISHMMYLSTAAITDDWREKKGPSRHSSTGLKLSSWHSTACCQPYITDNSNMYRTTRIALGMRYKAENTLTLKMSR